MKANRIRLIISDCYSISKHIKTPSATFVSSVRPDRHGACQPRSSNCQTRSGVESAERANHHSLGFSSASAFPQSLPSCVARQHCSAVCFNPLAFHRCKGVRSLAQPSQGRPTQARARSLESWIVEVACYKDVSQRTSVKKRGIAFDTSTPKQ